MEGSSSRDGNEGGQRGTSCPNKGNKTAKIALEKPLEPRRGSGIIKLERMRIKKDIKWMFLRTHHSQPQTISGAGILGLEGNRMTTSLQQPPYLQPLPYASFPPQRHPNFARQGTELVHPHGLQYYHPYARGSLPNNLVHQNYGLAYGTGGMSGHYRLPSVRPLGTYAASSYAHPSNMVPATLSLFKETPDHYKEGESTYAKREEGYQSGESTSKDSNDPHDLDLDLKL